MDNPFSIFFFQYWKKENQNAQINQDNVPFFNAFCLLSYKYFSGFDYIYL